MTALKGRTGIRLRVGDWRVIMDDDRTVLEVLEVGPRRGLRLMEARLEAQGLNDTVTIPRAEYEALQAAAEMLSDVQAYDDAGLTLAEGRDELIPEPFASRLMDGLEHPLAIFRELRGLSNADLARASGVNRVQIRDIEAGRATGSVRTVAALAEALGIDASDLVA